MYLHKHSIYIYIFYLSNIYIDFKSIYYYFIYMYFIFYIIYFKIQFNIYNIYLFIYLYYQYIYIIYYIYIYIIYIYVTVVWNWRTSSNSLIRLHAQISRVLCQMIVLIGDHHNRCIRKGSCTWSSRSVVSWGIGPLGFPIAYPTLKGQLRHPVTCLVFLKL